MTATTRTYSYSKVARLRASSLVALLTLLMSLVRPYVVAAQAPVLAGHTIQEVEFFGLVTLAEDSLRYYLELEVGATYDPATLNSNIQELWEKELIDDISVDVTIAEGGVKVAVTVTERPLLLSVDYQGLKKLNRGEIGDYLDRKRIDLYEGGPLDLGQLARMKSAIKELYAERGFRFADVNIELEYLSDAEARVIVTIDEGNKVKIGRVSFEGNEVFKSSKLQSQMKKTKKTNMLTRIRKRDVYNPATVQEDLEAVRSLYRDAGYKNIVIADPIVEVIEKKPDAATISGKKRRLALIIPIEEGERWKLGNIEIEGNTVLNDAILKGVFADPKGGWLRADVVDQGVEKITEFYNNSGYIFARVDTEIVEQENLVADVIVHIEENDQFRVGRIEFSGNTRTQDRVLRRELRLQEGMVFNSGALRNSLFKIQQLEYFALNEEDPVELDYDAEAKEVNLTLKGNESERTEVQFGGGFSEIDGFFLQASVRTRNFLGRGETLGVQVQTGRFSNLFDISYFVPWVRDKPQSAGLQIFKRDLDYDLFANQRVVRKEQGGVITFGRSMGLFKSISLSYNNSDVQDSRTQIIPIPDGEDITLQQDFSFKKSGITATYGFNSHDSRLEPTVGKQLRLALEYAGGILGGDDWIIRPTVKSTYTKPLTRKGLFTVGRVNFEAGYVVPYGDEDDGTPRELFFNDRFFLGGEQSIRGFEFRSIWVRDLETGRTITDANGFPLGGDKFLQFNLEYHVLVGGPFRVVMFYDAGNVFGDEQSVDLGALRMVAGIELRINLPIFGAPLRFIYSDLLNPYEGLSPRQQERFQSFDFSIGTSF